MNVNIDTLCLHACSILCLTFWKPMDCSLPGSSFYGIFPGTLLEWVVISSPRGSSQPRDRTCVACIGRPILYHWATWEALTDALMVLIVCVCRTVDKTEIEMETLRKWTPVYAIQTKLLFKEWSYLHNPHQSWIKHTLVSMMQWKSRRWKNRGSIDLEKVSVWYWYESNDKRKRILKILKPEGLHICWSYPLQVRLGMNACHLEKHCVIIKANKDTF